MRRYTYMFEQMMAGPKPWRFGHVHLPGGSTNLGPPAHMRCCMPTALFPPWDPLMP